MRNLADTGIIWVFCENGPQGVREVSYELLGAAARLAKDAGTRVIAVALGAGTPVEEMCARGADEVLLVEDAALDAPEEMRYTEEICALAREFSPDIFLLGGTMFGRSLAPRVAARLSTGLTADCTQLEIDKETGLLLQTRPAFGGNLFATILCPEARPQMATVRPKVFPMPEADRTRPVRVERRRAVSKPSMVELLSLRGGEAGVNLADYDVLVCVGQGIGGAENIARAEKLAEKLGGTLAASRPMVDAGILPYARQVGQTGKSVAPKLYLALGVSGAIQHLAGVNAEVLAAVNTDPEAPIFEHADYGIVQDCGAFLEEALAALG